MKRSRIKRGSALLQRERRRDAERRQTRGQPARHAPQIGQLHRGQLGIDRRFVHQQKHAAGRRVLLGAAVRDLGERLGRRDADRDRNPGPLQHGPAQLAGMAFQPALETAETEKGLIDRVDFEIGREAGDGAHHARAHIAVERVIARPHDHALGIDALSADVPGLAHRDAKRLGFVRARDHAAVIVRQHDDRPAAQPRLKDALAGGVEVIAIDERDRGRHGLSMRIDLVTTPQTSKARSAVTSISGKAGFSACSRILPSRGR